MSHSIVIGNMVRGFHVITGFESEEEANNFAAEYKREVGAEWRVASGETAEEFLADHKRLQKLQSAKEQFQDALTYDEPQPGEAITATGLSIDIQPKPKPDEELTANADQSVGGEDRGGEASFGSGSGGTNTDLPRVSESGDPVSGNEPGAPDDRAGAGGGSNTGDGGVIGDE